MHIIFPRSAALLAVAGLVQPLLLQPAIAQQESQLADAVAPAGEVPWLYEGSDVPVDRAWTFGELENGLRYAVRRNGVPPGQVSIRVRIDAGSLMENDDEQGYAHLLEHLTFRESTYVPEGEVIRIWQGLGVTFGSDSNAETTPTQTVYKLDLPNASAESLDQSMKILSGMIRRPALKESGVRAEVPVVLAEKRERAGAQARVGDATRETYFAGQRLAERAPIGTTESLMAANAEAVRAFHDRWYRPEHTVIAIAGDADPAIFEQLIGIYFQDWKGMGPTSPAPDFGDPDPDQPVARVVIEPSLPTLVNFAVLRPWRKVNDTIEYNQQLLIDLLAVRLINRRLETRARQGASYLQASVQQDDVSRSVDGTFVSVVPLDDDWEAALADVRAVIADATTNAPSEAEVERELREFDNALKIGVETEATEAGSKQADNIVQAVDIRETVATSETAYKVFRDMQALYTPRRLLASTQALFKGDVTRALLVTPQAENPQSEQAELADAVTRLVDVDQNARSVASSVNFNDLPAIGKSGKVVEAKPLLSLGVEELRFANGVTAILYPNDAEASKIDVEVRFGRGYQAISPKDAAFISIGENALVGSGQGELGQEELDWLTTGRRIQMDFEIENDAFTFSADTRASDLRDQLYLMADKLKQPKWDPNPVKRAIAGAKLAYGSYSISPQAVMERELGALVRDGDPRWRMPTPEELDSVTPASFRKFWQPLLKTGPIEVSIFGDFEREAAIKALSETFGALQPRKAGSVAAGATDVHFPQGGGEPVILNHKGDPNQAAAAIAWPTGGGREEIRKSRQLEILSQLFSNRLFDDLRDAAGASYSPQVRNSWPLDLGQGGHLMVFSQLEPGKVDVFFDIARNIAEDLVTTPVSDDELARVTEPLRQLISRASTGNTFWQSQLSGVSGDPSRLSSLRTIMSDFTNATPEEIQSLAAEVFNDATEWKLIILPERSAPDIMTGR